MGTPALPLPDSVADAEPKPVKVGEIRRFGATDGGVSGVAFSPDGLWMVCGGADGIIRLWDVRTGRELRRFEGHTDAVKGVAVSPDGKRVLSGSNDKTARLWDVATGRELRRLEGHGDGVSHVCFSPDGKIGASGSWDHTARLWELSSGRQLSSLGHGDFVVGLSFSPDGGELATGSWDRSVRLWDVKTGKELRRFEGHGDKVGDVAFAPDGMRVLSSSTDQTLRLWQVLTGHEVSRCEVGEMPAGPWRSRPMAVPLSVYDAEVILWDLAAELELHRFQGHKGQVTGLAFSPDGRTALSSSRDGSVRLWGLPSKTGVTKPRIMGQADDRSEIEEPHRSQKDHHAHSGSGDPAELSRADVSVSG